MYRFDQHGHMLRRGVLGNSVPEVEDVPGIACTKGIKHTQGLPAHRFRRRQQDGRIQVALQGNTIPDSPTRFA